MLRDELKSLNKLVIEYRNKVKKKPWTKKIIEKLIDDFTYHSSKIEGLTLNYNETISFLKNGFSSTNKLNLKQNREIESLMNHKEILKVYFTQYANKELTEQGIKDAQSKIFKTEFDNKPFDIYNAELGEYKNNPNGTLVKVSTGQPEWKEFLAPHLVSSAMAELVNSTNEALLRVDINSDSNHPIVIASKFHYDFVNIHPFEDGNGRTARLFTNLLVMKSEFPPLLILGEGNDKDKYIEAIIKSTPHNIDPLTYHFIDQMKNTITQSLELVKSFDNSKAI